LLLTICALTMTTVLLDMGGGDGPDAGVRFEAKLASVHVFINIGRRT